MARSWVVSVAGSMDSMSWTEHTAMGRAEPGGRAQSVLDQKYAER